MNKSAIHSVEEFMSTFNVGDEFHTITTWCEEPKKVETYKILGYFTYVANHPAQDSQHGAWRVKVKNSRLTRDFFISDLVNLLHGCFKVRDDADYAFDERLLAWHNRHKLVVGFGPQMMTMKFETKYGNGTASWTDNRGFVASDITLTFDHGLFPDQTFELEPQENTFEGVQRFLQNFFIPQL